MSEKQNKLYCVYWESPHDGDSILTVASSEIEAYEKVCKRLCDKGESPSFICPAVEVSEIDGYKIILEEKNMIDMSLEYSNEFDKLQRKRVKI